MQIQKAGTTKLLRHLYEDRGWHLGYKLCGPKFGSEADRRCRRFVQKGYLRKRYEKGYVLFQITKAGITYLNTLV
jgi:hypothetical protein